MPILIFNGMSTRNFEVDRAIGDLSHSRIVTRPPIFKINMSICADNMSQDARANEKGNIVALSRQTIQSVDKIIKTTMAGTSNSHKIYNRLMVQPEELKVVREMTLRILNMLFESHYVQSEAQLLHNHVIVAVFISFKVECVHNPLTRIVLTLFTGMHWGRLQEIEVGILSAVGWNLYKGALPRCEEDPLVSP